MTGAAEVPAKRWRRSSPLRVAIDIADRALRADIADACEEAGISVADAAAGDAADVALIDRAVATSIPAIVLAPDAERRSSYWSWPATVCAVVATDTDADTLAAIITCAAAGYVLTARGDGGEVTGTIDDAGGDDGADDGADLPALGVAGSALSSREREVLALLSAGASNKEIALALDVSVSTVKFHVAAIIHKLGARSRVDAVAIAIRAGMVMI